LRAGQGLRAALQHPLREQIFDADVESSGDPLEIVQVDGRCTREPTRQPGL
jgi:hypothetical protein